MAAARSRGNAASTCPAVRVPARKAATKASSRIGATTGMPAILVIPPKSARPVQEAEGLRQAKARGRRPRRRKPGAGRKPKLGPDDRLLLVLMYYRVYVTQVVLGGLFGVDAGTACRVIRAVGLALAGVFRIPERKVRLGPDELGEAFVDATEQPIHRPKRGQKRYYSGKAKRHTIKHQVVVVRKKKRPVFIKSGTPLLMMELTGQRKENKLLQML